MKPVDHGAGAGFGALAVHAGCDEQLSDERFDITGRGTNARDLFQGHILFLEQAQNRKPPVGVRVRQMTILGMRARRRRPAQPRTLV